MGIEPTTSGLDLPLLCRLSYEVGQRKSGTIYVVNRGEGKVRVHMNVPRVAPWFPLLGLTPSGLYMGSISTQIYTSELILCFTICVHSATRHYIHSYVPLLSLRRDSPPKSSPTFSVRPRSSVGRVTIDLIRRSWVRFPPRPKDFFFTSWGSLIPFTRANAQWVIHGFTSELILCFTICVHSATRHNIHMYPYFLFAAIYP